MFEGKFLQFLKLCLINIILKDLTWLKQFKMIEIGSKWLKMVQNLLTKWMKMNKRWFEIDQSNFNVSYKSEIVLEYL